MDGAIGHIPRTWHSAPGCDFDAIYWVAARFVNEVDSAAVYVNASTRFTDGGQRLGLAQKCGQHAEITCPVRWGLKRATTYKWILWLCGDGTIRAYHDERCKNSRLSSSGY